MLRALLAARFGGAPAAVRFARTAAGAPLVVGLDAHVSTAGCKGWSAVAVAPVAIGVDLEREGPDAADWVLREAYLKALGEGLRVDPERVRLARSGDAVALDLDGAAAPRGRGWRQAVAPGVVAGAVLLDGETPAA